MNETLKTDRQTLRFESDAGSSRSRWVAGGLAVAIIGWMGSGYILPSESAEPVAKSATPVKAVSVAVRQSRAQQRGVGRQRGRS
jgi:multidrug efflux system membrane fusion protein